jgi:predicted transcriptional regulator
MNRLLIFGPLFVSMLPLHAQAQEPNMAKLKTDAQQVVTVISTDKVKTEAFCQMRTLGEQIDQATQDKDTKKSEALIQKINDFEKQLGPEYLALIDALNEADPNSKDVQAVLSMFDRLDEDSCTH